MNSRVNTATTASVSPSAEIIAEIRAGRMVVLVDEEDRENEGDLLIAAEHANAEAINFMARYGRGLICLTLTEERCRQLNLPLMVSNNRSPLGTNFTVSIEAAEGVTTGISAENLIIMSSGIPGTVLPPSGSTLTPSLRQGATQTYSIQYGDLNNNPMPAGTTIQYTISGTGLTRSRRVYQGISRKNAK